jgi:hypothetical protein
VFTSPFSSAIDITLDVEAILPWASIRGIDILFCIAEGTPYGHPGQSIIRYATGYGGYPVIAYTVLQGTGTNPHIFRITAINDATLANDRLSIYILHV